MKGWAGAAAGVIPLLCGALCVPRACDELAILAVANGFVGVLRDVLRISTSEGSPHLWHAHAGDVHGKSLCSYLG